MSFRAHLDGGPPSQASLAVALSADPVLALYAAGPAVVGIRGDVDACCSTSRRPFRANTFAEAADFCHPDLDDDGYSRPADCDDKDPNRHPRAFETFCNGIDEDCNGVDECDADGDGDSVPADCNDKDPSISLKAKEIMCDGIDQDCDGPDCCANDKDGDGAPCSADCDDNDPATYPGGPIHDGCYWKDMNCDGTLDGICH